MTLQRPENDEYAGFYAGYVRLAAEIDVISALRNQPSEWQQLLRDVSAEKANFRYAADKWSIKELVGHVADAERVFAYRALRISRGDATPLAGFDENFYVANSNCGNADLADLVEEFSLLRQSNVLLFKNLPEAAWRCVGTASEAAVSVRALAFIMVGHVRHHENVLRERYLL